MALASRRAAYLGSPLRCDVKGKVRASVARSRCGATRLVTSPFCNDNCPPPARERCNGSLFAFPRPPHRSRRRGRGRA